MKKATLILIFVYIALWTFACLTSCVFGWLADPIEPVEPLEDCELQVITEPTFIKLRANTVTDLPEWAIIIWGTDTIQWIENFEIVADHIQILQTLAEANMSFDTMLVLDKTEAEGAVLKIDFILFFVEPPFGLEDVYIEWPAHSLWLWEKNPRSMYIGASLANDNDSALISTINQLPSWSVYGMHGTNLDSTRCDKVLGALLNNCKSGSTINWKGLPISQERIDQCEYQQVNLLL